MTGPAPAHAATPGQAAYEHRIATEKRRFLTRRYIAWDGLSPAERADEEAAAQAAISASRGELLAEHEQLRAQLDEARTRLRGLTGDDELFIVPHWATAVPLPPPAGPPSATASASLFAAAPGTGLYLAAIARLSAALRDIKDSYDPGTAAHDMAHTALDDVDQPQRLPDLRAQLDEARGQLGTIHRRLTALVDDLERSAAASHPSRKSEIERRCAEVVRGIIDAAPPGASPDAAAQDWPDRGAAENAP